MVLKVFYSDPKEVTMVTKWCSSGVQGVPTRSTRESPNGPQHPSSISILHLVFLFSSFLGGREEGSAQPVGFFNFGSGRVLDKILGSRSGSGRVGVSKYTIGYFRVSFLLLGISGYLGISWYVRYFRVFLGLPILTFIEALEGGGQNARLDGLCNFLNGK